MAQNPTDAIRFRRNYQQEQNQINKAVQTVVTGLATLSQRLDSTKLKPKAVLSVEGWFNVQISSSNTLTIELLLGGLVIATPVSLVGLVADATVYVDCRIVITSPTALNVLYSVNGISGVMPGSNTKLALTLTGNPVLEFSSALVTINGDTADQEFFQVRQ